MRLTHDSRYKIAYIYLCEKTKKVESLKITEELVIDLNSDGKVCGIELLNANQQLKDKTSPHLLFINEKTGEQKELILD